MPTKHQLERKQQYLDFVKWLDGEEKVTDTCGSYEYCAYCDKSKDYPCARAYFKHDSLCTRQALKK